MSDDQEEGEALPTAAIVSFAGEETHEFEAYGSDKTDLTYRDDVEKGDELVRRRDVEALIQEKISELHDKNRDVQDEGRPVPYPVHENIEEIKDELLDEVQQQ